ncbi:MAG TPA: hypothetical protein VER96_33865 [Polyangiaceae bacterium]|nr:hypothetical protein [Polyangiaceae bacterium]
MTISAAQYIGMRALFRAALAANSFLVANPSDGEVLSFFNQLSSEASGAAALPSAQQAAVGYAFRGILSGNYAGVSNPNDAQVLDFWAQLGSDAVGAAALPTARYQVLKQALLSRVALNYPGAANPSLQDLLGYFAAYTTINFASLFPGAYQVLQSDLGLTYGGTLLPGTTNTSTTVVTLTGAVVGRPVPIRTKATSVGTVAIGSATFDISFDGGSTWAMTGVQPTPATPVALTGAGTGASLVWAAGNAVQSNNWDATCSALTDQSGNGKHATTASSTTQPIIGIGINGNVELIGDGIDDLFITNGINLPAPGTTPYYVFAVFRYLATVGDACILGNGDSAFGNRVGCLSAAPSTGFYHKNANVAGVSVTVNPLNWNILEIKRSNNASDTTKIGAVTQTGNAGNDTATNTRIYNSPGASAPTNASVFAVVYTPNAPDWAGAIRPAVTSKYLGQVSL